MFINSMSGACTAERICNREDIWRDESTKWRDKDDSDYSWTSRLPSPHGRTLWISPGRRMPGRSPRRAVLFGRVSGTEGSLMASDAGRTGRYRNYMVQSSAVLW